MQYGKSYQIKIIFIYIQIKMLDKPTFKQKKHINLKELLPTWTQKSMRGQDVLIRNI